MFVFCEFGELGWCRRIFFLLDFSLLVLVKPFLNCYFLYDADSFPSPNNAAFDTYLAFNIFRFVYDIFAGLR